MKVAERIARQRADVLFVVVGGEEIHYGWDKLHTGSPSFKQWVLSQGRYDLSRFLFLGRILPEHLADVLRLSDLHIYLSAPFVVSWSLFNAMATGVPVLASDVPSVREIVEAGRQRPGRAALRRRPPDRDGPEASWTTRPLRPAGPCRPPDDRGAVQHRPLHPADQGVLRASGAAQSDPSLTG